MYVVWMWEIFCKILLVPHNIVMDLNNVMPQTSMDTIIIIRYNKIDAY